MDDGTRKHRKPISARSTLNRKAEALQFSHLIEHCQSWTISADWRVRLYDAVRRKFVSATTCSAAWLSQTAQSEERDGSVCIATELSLER